MEFSKQSIKFVSVIVCTFNGSSTIDSCIKSLIDQSADKHQYEIIVVDDGSTDDTFQILSNIKASNLRVIRNIINLGRPASRNIGLAAAKGEIISYIDDACFANRNYIVELIRSFSIKNVIGVGGLTKPHDLDSFSSIYLYEKGYGNPCRIEFVNAITIFQRLRIYLYDKFFPLNESNKNDFEVGEIYTGNAAFLKKYLKDANGFDEKMQTSEDTDLSRRLRKLFPDKKLIFSKSIVVVNDFDNSLYSLVRNTFKRSKYTFESYARSKKMPVIYPVPLMMLILLIPLSYHSHGMIFLFVLPIILYPWWVVKFAKRNNIKYLIMPFIELILDLTSNIGIISYYLVTVI